MDIFTASEEAYKNGFRAGVKVGREEAFPIREGDTVLYRLPYGGGWGQGTVETVLTRWFIKCDKDNDRLRGFALEDLRLVENAQKEDRV